MVDTPCFFACCSMAAPEALSRLTIARTVTPPVIICWAIVCIFCLSFCAFWMSYLTPAALNAFSRFGRSALSHRGDEAVSGRITPILPDALPPELLLPLPLLPLSLLPHAVAPTRRAAERAVRVMMRRRAMRTCHFVGVTEKFRAVVCARFGEDCKRPSAPLPDRDPGRAQKALPHGLIRRSSRIDRSGGGGL